MATSNNASPSDAAGRLTVETVLHDEPEGRADGIYPAPEYTPDGAWSEQNLLSLDGGGIRGYWTLLVLERLMMSIADEERAYAGAHSREQQAEHHSFWPHPFPENATQGPFSSDEEQQLKLVDGDQAAKCNALKDARKFLPCHYFDYICGSSTGALIAIMLGRFRMTVLDCLHEYETMSHKIFGKPRVVSQRNIGIVPWPKYSAAAMEKAFKEVTARRCEYNKQINPVTFPSREGLCNTFVTTYKYERTKGSSGSAMTLYLIRSYDHIEKEVLPNKRRDTDASHKTVRKSNPKGGKDIRKNFGQADSLQIWEVARAATAAPTYFKDIKFKLRSAEGATKMYFSDGGFGQTNNPTQEGVLEIESLHGKRYVGVVVSVGTARGSKEPGGKSILRRVKQLAETATDPENVERNMRRQAHTDEDFHYFRFNDPKGLGVALDEWKPNGLFTKRPGRKTLEKIKSKFYRWVQDPNSLKDINDCAKELVLRRRIRAADAPRWERYATGAKFVCGYNACSNVPFNDRKVFEEHLRRTHPNPDEDIKKTLGRMTRRWQYQAPPK